MRSCSTARGRRTRSVKCGDNLHTAVRKLRSALNDSSDTPRYIATVARRGYRFVAPVEKIYTAAMPAQTGNGNGTTEYNLRNGKRRTHCFKSSAYSEFP